VTNVVQAHCLIFLCFCNHPIKLPLVFPSKLPLVFPSTTSNYVNLFFPRTLSIFLCFSQHTINLPLVFPITLSNYVNLFFPSTPSSFLCFFQAYSLLAPCLSKHTVYLPSLSKHTLYFPPFFPSLHFTYISSFQTLCLTNQ
jgi:hypothetical protein